MLPYAEMCGSSYLEIAAAVEDTIAPLFRGEKAPYRPRRFGCSRQMRALPSRTPRTGQWLAEEQRRYEMTLEALKGCRRGTHNSARRSARLVRTT